MIALIIVAALALILVVAYFVSYNRFVSQRNLVSESWKQVDVELQRRYDLIPNLISTVKGYAQHEQATLERIVAARENAGQHATDSPADRQAPEAELGGAVRGVLAVAEQYPDLKASANFLELQGALSETEDRIAAGRRFYNNNVRAINTRIESVPSNIVASMGHFEKAEYFEIDGPEVRKNIKVDFNDITAAPVAGPPASQAPTSQAPSAPQPGTDA